jgi:Domain of unknown function (DUF3576)
VLHIVHIIIPVKTELTFISALKLQFRTQKACPRHQSRYKATNYVIAYQGYIMHYNRPALIMVSGAVLIGSMMTSGCAKNAKPKTDIAASQVNTIGVNSYLWRASLDALSFMPLVQTDSSGGVIVTDWYVNPKSPGERVKLTVSIIDQDLRADALRVAGSRQVAQNGQWVDAPLRAATVQKMEGVILTKARDLRRSAIAG